MKQLSKNELLENPGIDPGTSHMLSERSTTWANSPSDNHTMAPSGFNDKMIVQ